MLSPKPVRISENKSDTSGNGWRAIRATLGAAMVTVLLLGCIAEEDPDADNSAQTVVVNMPDEPPAMEELAPSTPIIDTLPIAGDVFLNRVTDLILITGQSNAQGSAQDFDANKDRGHSRLYAYTKDGWRIADLSQFWDGAHPGNFVDSDPDRVPYNNFGFHFGKTVVENRSDRTVAFVLITAPGMPISHWDKNGVFFNEIRSKALSALNQVPNKSAFDGILWHQGESDAEDSNQYGNKLNQLIQNFRDENWFGYNKPFICGETIGLPVNNQLMALNFDGDDYTACVEGRGLPALEDGIHFSGDGLRIIGERYGWKYIGIRPRL